MWLDEADAEFLSTPSARRATCAWISYGRPWPISIHALREEGDSLLPPRPAACPNFYPRPPRGGRLCFVDFCSRSVRFLSTPSARRATNLRTTEGVEGKISIHALREEGDPTVSTDGAALGRFLSTPSARRATKRSCDSLLLFLFLSTPSARRATLRPAPQPAYRSHFYPRPPRGGRRPPM